MKLERRKLRRVRKRMIFTGKWRDTRAVPSHVVVPLLYVQLCVLWMLNQPQLFTVSRPSNRPVWWCCVSNKFSEAGSNPGRGTDCLEIFGFLQFLRTNAGILPVEKHSVDVCRSTSETLDEWKQIRDTSATVALDFVKDRCCVSIF
jgi:hypothetical protein